ncbi:MAG TPA: EAL domain-containing protein, partial [Burkholderiales bacterium]|nr:EAL domain-containing protein [Burkholderiales bacterium]
VGDQLLQMAAIRLQNCLRKEDSIARLGGDEFVLTIAALSDSSDAALVAQKALDALNMPFFIGRRELHVSASIGISLYPADGTNVETLMRAADTAMYHAKRQGRGNYQFFTKALNKAAQQRLTMEGQLRQAFSQGEFTLYYQPQVDLESGRVISAEALLRWRKPGKDPISCNEFIAVAEETSLILPLGEWALRQACEHLKHWRDAGHAHLRLAINISARQFSQPSFHEIVAGILEKYRVPADAMDLEITESMLMQPSEDTLSNLKRISEMGIQLSVDDFGMGYSSLAYLRRFPIDALKIDRSFVSGIGDDPNDMAIVTAIISMAQSLHLKIIAEGVETLQQIKFLKSQGCLVGQGFYYGQPMSMESFTALLAEQATAYSIRVADR